MTDDFVTDGILPDDATGDADFDPNEFESDDILDDVGDTVADIPPDLAEEVGVIEEDDDDDGFPDE